jgi:FlaA1/EpsC-like NDP-sugar epimerase
MPVVNILDLAEVLLEGLAPKYGHKREDIDIEIIGTKLGEKMYEELMTEDEASRSLEREDMFIILPGMIESDLNESAYNATSIRSKEFISRDVMPISREEIKAILLRDGII